MQTSSKPSLPSAGGGAFKFLIFNLPKQKISVTVQALKEYFGKVRVLVRRQNGNLFARCKVQKSEGTLQQLQNYGKQKVLEGSYISEKFLKKLVEPATTIFNFSSATSNNAEQSSVATSATTEVNEKIALLEAQVRELMSLVTKLKAELEHAQLAASAFKGINAEIEFEQCVYDPPETKRKRTSKQLSSVKTNCSSADSESDKWTKVSSRKSNKKQQTHEPNKTQPKAKKPEKLSTNEMCDRIISMLERIETKSKKP